MLVYYPVWLAGAALAEMWSRKPMAHVSPVTVCAVFATAVLMRVASGSTVVSVVSAILLGDAIVWAVAALGNRGTGSVAGRLLEWLGIHHQMPARPSA